jgi:hypothetical protein
VPYSNRRHSTSEWWSFSTFSMGAKHFRSSPIIGHPEHAGLLLSCAMCGRLRVGKDNLHVAELSRCSHVFGLLARFA